ncbi:MAG: KUP/HAK/KT family potassium transporter [Saprospiraceae bacterium]
MRSKVHDKVTTASLLVAIGIIYGDIGTSPLYAFKAILGDRTIDEVLVYGGVSCVFWTLVFQTSIKYIWLTLRADNDGEGGIFSLYALVRRFGRGLVTPTMIGAAALLADGLITPPITIMSAIEGLGTLKGLEHIPIIPIVIGIISAFFIIQRFGTQKVGTMFGPVMMIWFTMLFILGFNQIIQHPGILKALNPYYAFELLARYPGGFWLLGAVFLATTGAEALYFDLGHCGIKNIRITWVFVKTCLVTNYLGQAAWAMQHIQTSLDGKSPFFEVMPHWFLLIGILIATAAAIIASQAVISGSYTLISEAVNLNLWPRVTIRQPSETKGQIYVPSINLLLWAGCCMIVLFFKTSTSMEAAYGLAIILAMMMTTTLLNSFLMYRLKWNKIATTGIITLFGSLELCFFIANIKKFPEGGYITILLAFVFFSIMYVIFNGRKISNRMTKWVNLDDFNSSLKELSEDNEIPKFATHLIYLTKANTVHQIEQKIVNSILSKNPKRADVYWFLHLHRTEAPYTLEYNVHELLDDKVIKVNLHVGFRIQPLTELYFKQIVRELVMKKELNLHMRADGATKYNTEPDFKFVVIEKYISVENKFTAKEEILLNSYFFLKNLGLSDEKAFGLDKSDVIVESIPLVIHPVEDAKLKRQDGSFTISHHSEVSDVVH